MSAHFMWHLKICLKRIETPPLIFTNLQKKNVTRGAAAWSKRNNNCVKAINNTVKQYDFYCQCLMAKVYQLLGYIRHKRKIH